MPITIFLSTLPAILGIVGFVVYQLLIRGKQGNVITTQIIAKIRNTSPDDVHKFQNLKPIQLERLLSENNKLKEKIGKQDFELLKQALEQQYKLDKLVYIIVTILVALGILALIYTGTLPKPLLMKDIQLKSNNEEAKGLAVDLDELLVSWKFDGESEEVSVYLENVQSKQKSVIKKTSSSQLKLNFSPAEYQAILDSREKGSYNRVKVICQSKKEVYESNEFQLRVGIKILVFYDWQSKELCFTALIDNSSIPNYSFEAQAIVYRKSDTIDILSFGGGKKMRNLAKFPVRKPNTIRWETLRVAYFGPDDNRIVRRETMVSTK